MSIWINKYLTDFVYFSCVLPRIIFFKGVITFKYDFQSGLGITNSCVGFTKNPRLFGLKYNFQIFKALFLCCRGDAYPLFLDKIHAFDIKLGFLLKGDNRLHAHKIKDLNLTNGWMLPLGKLPEVHQSEESVEGRHQRYRNRNILFWHILINSFDHTLGNFAQSKLY